MNYRLGWIMILGMTGALAGCGDSIQDLIEDIGDLRIDPPTIEPPTLEPPWGHPPDEPDNPGVIDAGAMPGAVDVEPPVNIEPCGPEPHEPPPSAADAGPPPVEPPPTEPEPDAGSASADAGPPVEPPPVEPPPIEPPPVKPPPVKPPPVKPPPVEPPAATSFEADVWPIFVTGCNPCHTALRAGGHSVGSADLAIAFADATRLGSTLVARLDGGGMPLGCAGNPGDPGCIALDDLATVQAWLDEGLAP